MERTETDTKTRESSSSKTGRRGKQQESSARNK